MIIAGDPGADAGGSCRLFGRDGGEGRVPWGEVRVRAKVVHGGVSVEGLLPGDPGLELPAPDREDVGAPCNCNDRHRGKTDPRHARGALVHPNSVAAVAGDWGQVKVAGVTRCDVGSPLRGLVVVLCSFVELKRACV